MSERTEMDEYLLSHPYLDRAKSDTARLLLWMSKQPESNILLQWLEGALTEAADASKDKTR